MRLLLFGFFLMNSFIALSQERPAEPMGCHENDAVLYGVAKDTPPDKLITVVAHLGLNETRPNLNQRRLHNVLTYLTEFIDLKHASNTITLTEGEKVKGYGRMEFYVDAKLIAELTLRENADLIAVNCCAGPDEAPCPTPERNFYPCLDRHAKRRKNR